MAAEDLSSNDFSSWNDTIYFYLQSELALLEGEGYKCINIGDMNAHIGVPMESRFCIIGNREGINVNGGKLINFLDSNDLVLLNKEDICSGTFTLLTLYSSAILDYALVSKALFPEVLRMGIDDEVNFLAGSDHIALRVDLQGFI